MFYKLNYSFYTFRFHFYIICRIVNRSQHNMYTLQTLLHYILREIATIVSKEHFIVTSQF